MWIKSYEWDNAVERIAILERSLYDLREAHARLLAYLKLHEMPGTPAPIRIVTEEEWQEKSAKDAAEMARYQHNQYAAPAGSYYETSIWELGNSIFGNGWR